MATPFNLMVESSEQDVIAHLSRRRSAAHPYHLRLPAWLIDNVRCGSELVCRQGTAAADSLFVTLDGLRQWKGGKFAPVLERGRFVSRSDDLAAAFLDLKS